MSSILFFVLATLALAFATHVVLRPEAYLRRRRRDGMRELIAMVGGDREVAERLVFAEVRRGAPSYPHAIDAATERLRRERSR